MGLCEPGQVGNEAAISSSFQVRWASHRGPVGKVAGSLRLPSAFLADGTPPAARVPGACYFDATDCPCPRPT